MRALVVIAAIAASSGAARADILGHVTTPESRLCALMTLEEVPSSYTVTSVAVEDMTAAEFAAIATDAFDEMSTVAKALNRNFSFLSAKILRRIEDDRNGARETLIEAITPAVFAAKKVTASVVVHGAKATITVACGIPAVRGDALLLRWRK